jgi:hypothetical protein
VADPALAQPAAAYPELADPAPGHSCTGDDPDGFMPVADVVATLTRARHLPSPQLTGTPATITDLNSLAAQGVRIAGRLGHVTDGVAQFSGALANTCALARRGHQRPRTLPPRPVGAPHPRLHLHPRRSHRLPGPSQPPPLLPPRPAPMTTRRHARPVMARIGGTNPGHWPWAWFAAAGYLCGSRAFSPAASASRAAAAGCG